MRYTHGLCQIVLILTGEFVTVLLAGFNKKMFLSIYRVNESSMTISPTPCSSISSLSFCHLRTAREKTNSTHVASASSRYNLIEQTAEFD